MSKKQEDFGEKIGGARKDMWASRGLDLTDFSRMTEAEKDAFVKKAEIWPKPDYKKLYEDEGRDRNIVFFIKEIRDALPVKPEYVYYLNTEDTQKSYIEAVTKVRDTAMACYTLQDVLDFRENCNFEGDEYNTICSQKFTKALPYRKETWQLNHLKNEVKRKKFLYSEEEMALSEYSIYLLENPKIRFESTYGKNWLRFDREDICGSVELKGELNDPDGYQEGTWFAMNTKDFVVVGRNFATYDDAKEFVMNKYAESNAGKPAKKRKTNLPLEKLKNVRMTGFNYRNGLHATEEDYLTGLGCRAVEFGNWVSDKERVQHMDMAFDSLMNLAAAIDVDVQSLLFGKLAVAFGARGISNAAAHYEPLKKVINLTKKNGAGSLAHEMGHFLDYQIGDHYMFLDCATAHLSDDFIPDSFKALMSTMKKKELTQEEAFEKLHAALVQRCEKLRSTLDSMVRTNDMTPEQFEEYDVLACDFINEERDEAHYSNSKASDALKAVMAFLEKDDIPNTIKYNVFLLNIIKSDVIAMRKAADNAASENPHMIDDTDYYKSAVALDGGYAHGGHDYFKSDVELFARAFAAYVKDKLAEKGIVDDYLCGHADTYAMSTTGHKVYVSPQGKEREAINKAFDAMIAELIADDVLKKAEEPEEKAVTTASVPAYSVNFTESALEGNMVQLGFDF